MNATTRKRPEWKKDWILEDWNSVATESRVNVSLPQGKAMIEQAESYGFLYSHTKHCFEDPKKDLTVADSSAPVENERVEEDLEQEK